MENIDLDAPTPKEIPAVEATTESELVAGSAAPLPTLKSEPASTSTLPAKESNGIPAPSHTPAKNGTAAPGAGNGFVPLVTVVGFHHAR